MSSPASADPSPGGSGHPIRAVAFDAFTVFDRHPVDDAAEDVFPAAGAALTDAWSVRQFEYTCLRTLTHTYADFWTVTQDALDFAAQKAGLELTPRRPSATDGRVARTEGVARAPASIA
jgi:2-haloacid dehalogenase